MHLKIIHGKMCMEILIDVLGYCGGFVLGIQLLPQIYKIYITKSSKDISRLFLQMNILGLGLMTAYGVLTDAKPLYIPCSISLFSTIVVYLMTIIYNSPENHEVIRHTSHEEEHPSHC